MVRYKRENICPWWPILIPLRSWQMLPWQMLLPFEGLLRKIWQKNPRQQHPALFSQLGSKPFTATGRWTQLWPPRKLWRCSASFCHKTISRRLEGNKGDYGTRGSLPTCRADARIDSCPQVPSPVAPAGRARAVTATEALSLNNPVPKVPNISISHSPITVFTVKLQITILLCMHPSHFCQLNSHLLSAVRLLPPSSLKAEAISSFHHFLIHTNTLDSALLLIIQVQRPTSRCKALR